MYIVCTYTHRREGDMRDSHICISTYVYVEAYVYAQTYVYTHMYICVFEYESIHSRIDAGLLSWAAA